MADLVDTHRVQRAEVISVEQIEFADAIRHRTQLALLGGEVGLGRRAERARRLCPLGLLLALRIVPEGDAGEELARGLARLDRRQLLDAAERDAPGAAAVGRAILRDPRLAQAFAILAQPAAEATQVLVKDD